MISIVAVVVVVVVVVVVEKDGGLGRLPTDQEYKWIDEYWPFPDSLVLTHSLNCFSYHLYLFLYNVKLSSINYN